VPSTRVHRNGIAECARSKCAQQASLGDTGHDDLLAGADQDAQCFAVAVGAQCRNPAGIHAHPGQDAGESRWDQICLSRGADGGRAAHSMTSSPAAVSLRIRPVP